MARKFKDWTHAFVDYTSGLRSPEIFRLWSGVAAVSGALARQSYMRLTNQKLYANLYLILISDPGIGKSNAIKHSRKLLRNIKEIKLTPTRTTKRAFYNTLEKASKVEIRSSAEMYRHCSLIAMIDEFGVFVKPKDNEFMVDLTDVYDCPELFDYVTATQGQNSAPNVFLTLIGGTTPKYLRESWTSTVLDEGFPARIILVWSDQVMNVDLFSDNDDESETVDNEYEKALVSDLKEINKLKGRFTWAEDSRKEMADWFSRGMPPIPGDPRMQHYCTRRHVHACKLCMIISAARRDDMEITMGDLEAARDMLLEAEAAMPKAIQGIGANPIRDQMVMVQNFVRAEFTRTHKGVEEYKVRDLLMNELDPYRVPAMLNELVIGRWLIASGQEPNRLFLPGSLGGPDALV